MLNLFQHLISYLKTLKEFQTLSGFSFECNTKNLKFSSSKNKFSWYNVIFLYNKKILKMKKTTALLLAFFSIGFMQAQKLEKGVYKSSSTGAETLKLKVDEAGNFEFVILSGQITYQNDSIYFYKPEKKSETNYQIREVADATVSHKLKIDIDAYTQRRLFYTTFIAFQASEKDELSYKRFSKYFSDEYEGDYSYDENPIRTIEVEKAKYLYLVNVDYGNVVTKFEIPSNVNHIKLDYSNSDMNLLGYLDNNNMLQVTNGKSRSVLFSMEEDNGKEVPLLKPSEIFVDNDFTEKYNFVEIEEEAVDSAIYVGEIDYYDFKIKKFNSYKEAQSDTKDGKFLIVLKSSDKTYKSITERYESETKYSMYGEYDASKDQFNFYQATEKDKKLCDPYLKEEGIVVFNENGDVLYFKEVKLMDKNPVDDDYYFIEKLQEANLASKIDHIVANKKATTEDLKKVFINSNLRNEYYESASAVEEVVEVPLPPPLQYDSNEPEAVEDVKRAVEAAAQEAVDAVAEAVRDFDTSSENDDKNFYKIKSSKDAVYKKWYELVDASVGKPLDTLLLPTFKRAINNRMLIDSFFKKETSTKNDLKIVDYLQKNYPEIKEYEDKSEYLYYDEKTINCLNEFYQNQYSNENSSLSEDVLSRYQYYITNINSSSYYFEEYLNVLQGNKDIEFVLNEYEKYFNKIYPEGSNLIEALDKSFSDNGSSDWESYKSSFATLANNIAWKVVENRLTNSYLQKAIHWSETSVKLYKTNHYSLDTLAQLYYLNGEKQKAIATEQMAIDNVEDDNDSEKENYKNVLQQMKNGSY